MRKKIKKYSKVLLSLVLIWLVIFLIVNYQSIKDLARFIIDYKNYKYLSTDMVPADTDYKFLYELVNLNRNTDIIPTPYRLNEPGYNKLLSPVEKINYNRMLFIMKYLDSAGINYDTIWVSDRVSRSPVYTCNIFIKNDLKKNFTLITAHYDNLKIAGFQGALDNSASVAILLNIIRKNRELLKDKNVAFLFTTMEEQGFAGAAHFLKYSLDNNLKINNVICLDGIGRGKLSVMGNSMGGFGFKFRNCFFKEKLFNGYKLRNCPDYFTIENSVINFKKYNIEILPSFLSSTDGRVFINVGIPTVHLTASAITHFLKVMHTRQDRIDGLHYKSIKQCEDVLSDYIKNMQ